MFRSSKDVMQLQNTINHNLLQVSDWLNSNRLSINVKKTHIMIWSPNPRHVPKLDIQMNNQSIELVIETRFLGVIIDDKLSWSKHIRHVSKKVSKGVGIIKKL